MAERSGFAIYGIGGASAVPKLGMPSGGRVTVMSALEEGYEVQRT